MAGTQAGFSASEFKDAIHFAMDMGLPNADTEKATFYWDTKRTFDKKDSAGLPLALKARPTSSVEKAPVQVSCAVEYARTNNGIDGNSAGAFDGSRATITLLDEDYEQVKDADYVSLGGDRYEIDFKTSVGLFDVTVYQMFLRAWDET